jgi:hypothetical protein
MSQTTITPVKKQTLRFYSQEEKKALKPFINKNLSPSEENLKDFCKKYNRNFPSVQVYIYTNRKRKVERKEMLGKNSPKAALKPTLKNKSKVNLSKGEFKIPISNWNVTNDNGQFYFVVKF